MTILRTQKKKSPKTHHGNRFILEIRGKWTTILRGEISWGGGVKNSRALTPGEGATRGGDPKESPEFKKTGKKKGSFSKGGGVLAEYLGEKIVAKKKRGDPDIPVASNLR